MEVTLRPSRMFYVSDQQLLTIVAEIVDHTDLSRGEEDLLRVIHRDVQDGDIFVEPERPLKRLEEDEQRENVSFRLDEKIERTKISA